MNTCYGSVLVAILYIAVTCAQVQYMCAWPQVLIIGFNIALLQSQEAKSLSLLVAPGQFNFYYSCD